MKTSLIRRDKSPEERFWLQTNKDGPIHPVHGQCWIWIGTCTGDTKFPYGCIYVNNRPVGAHRFSYMLHNHKIPADLFVLHHCDNTRCVNPSHLFLGDRLDNNKDMVTKERHPRGESHGKAVLNTETVLLIRKLYKSGQYTCRQLGNRYGVSKGAIQHIVKRFTWKHI